MMMTANAVNALLSVTSGSVIIGYYNNYNDRPIIPSHLSSEKKNSEF